MGWNPISPQMWIDKRGQVISPLDLQAVLHVAKPDIHDSVFVNLAARRRDMGGAHSGVDLDVTVSGFKAAAVAGTAAAGQPARAPYT